MNKPQTATEALTAAGELPRVASGEARPEPPLLSIGSEYNLLKICERVDNELYGVVDAFTREKVIMSGLREALAASPPAAREAPPAWQPIETAPKDGTWLLVTGCNTSPLVLVAGYRVEANRNSYPYDRWVAWGGMHVEYPTHWLPLPVPPAHALAPTGEEP